MVDLRDDHQLPVRLSLGKDLSLGLGVYGWKTPIEE